MTWFEKFQSEYRPILNQGASGSKRGLIDGLYQRGQGFETMFHYLLSKAQHSYNIIETGTLRNPGQWKDGQSARLFTEFVTEYGGRVRSVDIDPTACTTAKQALDPTYFNVTCSDSVIWLQEQYDIEQVDLFYLDSWDVKWNDDILSARHHLLEFQAIQHKLKPGVMLAIDDNSRFLHDNRRTGKGRMIVEYLDSLDIYPVYDQHQIIYIFSGAIC